MPYPISNAQQILQKIQFLMDSLKSEREITTIELDLLRDYLRKFYDLTFDLEKNKDQEYTMKIVETTTEIKEEKPTPPAPERISHEKPEPVIIQEEVEIKEEKKITTTESDPASVLADRVEKAKNFLNEKLAAEKEILADKIKSRKADDLRTAIDLNEKFFFINELFKGDTLAFDKAIRFLNGLTSMQDAQVYIEKELGVNYNWSAKREASEKFIRAISVKYPEQ